MDAEEFAKNENVMMDVADCITSQLPFAGQDDFGDGRALQNHFASVSKRFKGWNVSSALIWRNFGLILSWFSFCHPGYAN